MHRPQKTSKGGYPLEHRVEPEHTAEACSILYVEPRRKVTGLFLNISQHRYRE
ncbi:hypothetical protein [Halalkalibacter alkalisediminis]|uniref:Uncharacterized protein n=1 Tax=Halalkalibacter alkalisediminis TaxID=935616 RepID=A0ABV6NL30_9BACI|nr:hypothetical protein [Halalkalibacter alkalisediminis]